MQSSKSGQIYFNRTNSVYKPGEIISGRVEINCDSTKIVRGIFITIIGKARVSWSESHSTKNSNSISSPTSVSYSNTEKYFKETFYVLDEKVELAAGQHIYQFKYLLPIYLPPSFNEVHCKITYRVKAVIYRPWKINKYVEAPFIIETVSNHGKHSRTKGPNKLEMEKQFGLIFKSKPLKVTIQTPRFGFAPGEIIPLTLEVNNESDILVKSISIKLRQVLTLHATTKTRTEEKTLAKHHIESEVKPTSSTTFSHYLHVPEDVVLHDLSKCNIIDIDYQIKVELHTAGFTRNLVGKMLMYPLKTASAFTNISET